MTLDKLLKFIKAESARLKNKYGVQDPKVRILGRMAKLTEEVGELSSEALAFHGFQSKSKLEKHTRESLEHELADVIICTLLMAEAMDVDIKKALTAKIKKIEARYK
jgi:NTP pyrophosphatase (non-canonical NTP hydrolase)